MTRMNKKEQTYLKSLETQIEFLTNQLDRLEKINAEQLSRLVNQNLLEMRIQELQAELDALKSQSA